MLSFFFAFFLLLVVIDRRNVVAQSQGSDNLFQASLLALNVVGNIVVVIDDGLHLILVFIREFDSVLN